MNRKLVRSPGLTSMSSSTLLSACLTLLAMSPASSQEIYKWVDKNGKTHYSAKKEDAGEAQAAEVKIKVSPPSAPTLSPSTMYGQNPEWLRNRGQTQNPGQESYRPPMDQRPPSLSNGGRVDHTDASKCNLARDVLSGAVRLRNGNPTDDNARQTAESDVRLFCR